MMNRGIGSKRNTRIIGHIDVNSPRYFKITIGSKSMKIITKALILETNLVSPPAKHTP